MFVVTFLKISSILLALVGALFAIPLGVALGCHEADMILPFVIPMAASFILCALVNIFTRKTKVSMSIKQTFIIVAMSWVVMSFMGSVPLALSGYFNNYADALFESVSGFSTTGSTAALSGYISFS